MVLLRVTAPKINYFTTKFSGKLNSSKLYYKIESVQWSQTRANIVNFAVLFIRLIMFESLDSIHWKWSGFQHHHGAREFSIQPAHYQCLHFFLPVESYQLWNFPTHRHSTHCSRQFVTNYKWLLCYSAAAADVGIFNNLYFWFEISRHSTVCQRSSFFQRCTIVAGKLNRKKK